MTSEKLTREKLTREKLAAWWARPSVDLLASGGLRPDRPALDSPGVAP